MSTVPTVGMLITCLADLMRPQIAEATLQLLGQCKVNPVIPQTQTCCGQPALNSGRRGDARDFARKLATEFGGCDIVVAPSGSCIGTIRTHLPALFAADEPGHEEVTTFASKCQELSQFLCARKFKPTKQDTPCRIAFHDSCAGLRELSIKDGPRSLLQAAGYELIPLEGDEICCGFGGTFSVKFSAVSGQLADNKCTAALATKADVLAMGDLGCILNIEGRMLKRGDSMPLRHWAELLVN